VPAPQHILIVNYDFPPNRGIGGRRWGKLSKQLALQGYIVHVIKADALKDAADSAWTDDVSHPNIHVTSLARKYPAAFSHPKSDIISKLKYRYHKWNLKRKTSGTIYDLSIGWEELLIPTFRKIIHEFQITNVIATGAPWNMLYELCLVKKEFPGIHYLIDFRDPWITATNYGMAGLEPKRKKAEEKKQTFVLEHADVITTPADHITEELFQWSQNHCKNIAKFELLSHFYDENDISTNEDISKKNNDKITFIYGGDLYLGIDEQLLWLQKQLLNIRGGNPDLYKRIQIKIYTNTPNTTFENIEAVELKPSIGKKIFHEIHKADFCLVMLPNNKKNDLTTKFIEYLAFRKPLIVIASEGSASNFVEKNKIGLRLNDTNNNLENIATRALSGILPYDNSFDFGAYSLPSVTNNLIKLLK